MTVETFENLFYLKNNLIFIIKMCFVLELESQDPSFEDDETADYFPRTKQTIQMLMRDLDTMEELGIIT